MADTTLISVSVCNKYLAGICNDNYFWFRKISNMINYNINATFICDYKNVYRTLVATFSTTGIADNIANRRYIFAVLSGNLDLVRLFSLSLEEKTGSIHINALNLAIKKGYRDIAKYLIDNGGNIFDDGVLALELACEWGQLHIVKYLIETGADIYAKWSAPIRVAAANGHVNILRYFVDMGGQLDSFMVGNAAKEGQLASIEFLVNMGIDPHDNNELALITAAEEGHLHLTKYLVDIGANIHAVEDMALQMACREGNWKS